MLGARNPRQCPEPKLGQQLSVVKHATKWRCEDCKPVCDKNENLLDLISFICGLATVYYNKGSVSIKELPKSGWLVGMSMWVLSSLF